MDRKPGYGFHSKLNVFEDKAAIFVRGETFGYGFDKKSGLINRLEVLGDDFLRSMGSGIPNIYISPAIDPKEAFYSAEYEDQAECDIISADPYEVHIRTHGVFHNSLGDTFPVRYRITYEIQNDGTMFVIVNNKAYEPCTIRWLCISRGILNPSFCKYFSHLADQSKVDTTGNYTFKEVPPGKAQDQMLFEGEFIPWFWFGNDETGVEVSIWDVSHHRCGETVKSVDPFGSASANILCISQVSTMPNGILWEIFSIRNAETPVNEGWEQTNYFAMSATPSKHYDPKLSDLRAFLHDPRRHGTPLFEYLTDDRIKALSQQGYNLIIGRFSHEDGIAPNDELQTRRIISTCHKLHMRIIPHVSLMELSEDTEIFKEHGTEWQLDPVVEYEDTSLMCPGAEGWREHWKQEIKRLVEDYDFDGLYVDFRYDRLACRNPQHGCQKRYIRPTFVWVRDMLRYAYVKIRHKLQDSIIIGGTDLLPISMICSWVDVRLVGRSGDIRLADQIARYAFYNSYRLGCGSLMCLDNIQVMDHHAISLSLLYMMFPLLSQERSQEEAELVFSYWNVLRFFGVNSAKWYPGFLVGTSAGGKKVVTASHPDLYVNVHRHNAWLLTLVNLSSDEVSASVSVGLAELGFQDDKKYLVYEPNLRKFFGNQYWECKDLRNFQVTVPEKSFRLLYVREYPQNPILLFALGSDGVLEERWDAGTDTLRFKICAPIDADVSVAVYCPLGRPSHSAIAGKEIHPVWDEDQKLALFDIRMSNAVADIEVQR